MVVIVVMIFSNVVLFYVTIKQVTQFTYIIYYHVRVKYIRE